ncbi:MAG: hypothetical protein R2788_07170 [Saprospiraceae bacterium]
MDLNGKAGLAKANPAFAKGVQGEEKSTLPIFFPRNFLDGGGSKAATAV